MYQGPVVLGVVQAQRVTLTLPASSLSNSLYLFGLVWTELSEAGPVLTKTGPNLYGTSTCGFKLDATALAGGRRFRLPLPEPPF